MKTRMNFEDWAIFAILVSAILISSLYLGACATDADFPAAEGVENPSITDVDDDDDVTDDDDDDDVTDDDDDDDNECVCSPSDIDEIADDIANELKNDDKFISSIKGEKGEQGENASADELRIVLRKAACLALARENRYTGLFRANKDVTCSKVCEGIVANDLPIICLAGFSMSVVHKYSCDSSTSADVCCCEWPWSDEELPTPDY